MRKQDKRGVIFRNPTTQSQLLHSISGGRQVSREDLVRLPALGVGGRDQRGRRIESAESATGQLDGVGQGDASLLVSPVVARSISVVCNNATRTPISAPSERTALE
jgi:hypothetical protein